MKQGARQAKFGYTSSRAGQAFRFAVAAVIRADCALGAFYRCIRSRLGPAQAVVATAHKIARVVYRIPPRLDLGEPLERFPQRGLDAFGTFVLGQKVDRSYAVATRT